jgi:threonine synthase
MSWFSHLDCSRPCGAAPRDPRASHHLCGCGAPLFARYDLERAAGWSRATVRARPPDMWRYREMMPVFDGEEPVTLGEGFTPLLPARELGRRLGLAHLQIKDESLNPTNSFKARGLSAAVTRARALGAETLAMPSAGNAANALAAYAARARLQAQVFLPQDVKRPFIDECELYGAQVTLVEGVITDAARIAADRGAVHGWYDLSTLKEPYRLEGKKTMAYELVEQLDGRLPDWIVYPTGGGTGLVGMWKAFAELEAIGWLARGQRPRMVSVQAEGCAPIVRAFEAGDERAGPWPDARTVADGLRVPHAVGDFLMLRALRESGGTAVAVSDADMLAGMRALGDLEGVSAAPEGGASVAALQRLQARGIIQPDHRIVLFNTGGALKYLELLVPRKERARDQGEADAPNERSE